MNDERLDIESCVVFLKEIIDRWPKANDDEIENHREVLCSYLADGFEDGDLHNKIEKVAKIAAIEKTTQGVRIDFCDLDGYPQRAELHVLPGNELRLRSLKFQCPVCFGEGVNDGDHCGMCGGTGWGAS